MSDPTHHTDTDRVSTMTSVKRLIVAGYSVIVVFLLVFVGWAGNMPLSSAAIAKGVVGVEGRKKTIQHLDGGIVESIRARDGDVVNVGDVLIQLDDNELQANFRELENRLMQLEAEHSRWLAEVHDRQAPDFPAWLLEHQRTERATSVVQTQNDIHAARAAAHAEALASLAYELQLVDEEARAIDVRLRNLQAKGELIDAELVEHRKMVSQGLITRAQVFELTSEQADVRLEMDDGLSTRVQLKQRRAQLAAQSAQLSKARHQVATEEATRAANEAATVRQQYEALRARLARLELRSPIDGYVVNSQVNTVGGVVTAGQVVMDIMPRNGRLLIESRVDPKDRDSIVAGQPAEVRFPAFNRRSSFPMSGVVKVIAADSAIDAGTQLPYFKTIVKLDEKSIEPGASVDIHPGMDADVIILTGEQTVLDYLISPLSRSFNRALREE